MAHDTDHVLLNARNYTSIDNCGQQVYLKYDSAIDYDNSQNSETSQKKTFDITLESIEMIRGINRYLNSTNHKSHVYSVVVNTDLLNGLTEQPKMKDNLKYEIQNCVRQIVTSLAPAQTQLLNVVINDIV